MHRLKAQARDRGDEADEAPARERAREERPREQAPDARRGFALEDQPRPQPHGPNLRMLLFETVEPPLDLGFVAGVEARRDPVRRAALVDEPFFRPGRMASDGGGIDESWHACLGNRLEDATRAVD